MVLRINVLLTVSEAWVYLCAKKKYLVGREKLKVQKKWMIEESMIEDDWTENGRGNKIQSPIEKIILLPFHLNRK